MVRRYTFIFSNNKKGFELSGKIIIYILIAIGTILLMYYGIAEAAKRIFG